MTPKISTAGVYDIPMSEYHSDCCDGPSVSGSVLWHLLDKCPARMWATYYGNPDRVPDETTKALDFGKAAHALALGEPEFASNFLICPHDNLAKKPGYDWNIEWKASVKAGTEKRTLVRADDFETVKAMAAALRKSPQVGGAFTGGKAEQSLIWQDAETGVWLKSRPDYLPDDPTAAFLQQFKTAESIRPDTLGRNAFKYGYHLSAALEVDGVKAVMGVDALGIAHIVQEKEDPYLAELRMFTSEQIEHGRRAYRRALRLFAECWERHMAGKPLRVAWPGYTETPQYFETPYAIRKEIEEFENGNAGSAGNAGNQVAGNDDRTGYARAG
jgi:hypothetical protein